MTLERLIEDLTAMMKVHGPHTPGLMRVEAEYGFEVSLNGRVQGTGMIEAQPEYAVVQGVEVRGASKVVICHEGMVNVSEE